MTSCNRYQVLSSGTGRMAAALTWVLSSLVFIPVTAFLSYTVYLLYVHWKYRHLPGPKRDCFYRGNVPFFQRERAKGRARVQMWIDIHREFGPLFVFWAFHKAILVVSDPELLKKCLVSLNLPKSPGVYNVIGRVFGQRLAGRGVLNEIDHGVWKKRRAILNPAFHRRYLMNLMSAFNSSCDVFLAKIGEFSDGKTPVDMAEQFARVTLDVIGKVS